MKRFVLIYRDKTFPVRSKSAERVRAAILRAYSDQDDKEVVRFIGIGMLSKDIANGNYLILGVDEWFAVGTEVPNIR